MEMLNGKASFEGWDAEWRCDSEEENDTLREMDAGANVSDANVQMFATTF